MSVRGKWEEGRRGKEVRQRARDRDVTDVTDVSPREVGRRKKGKAAIPVSVTSVSWIQAIGMGEFGIGNWE